MSAVSSPLFLAANGRPSPSMAAHAPNSSAPPASWSRSAPSLAVAPIIRMGPASPTPPSIRSATASPTPSAASTATMTAASAPPPSSSSRSGHAQGQHRKRRHRAQRPSGSSSSSAPAPFHPAMLSRVAAQFRQRIVLATHVRDGMTYSSCFSGKDAIDVLAAILRSPDRNLACIMGRAMQAQRFFHDVNYTMRLRDSKDALYQFFYAAPAATTAVPRPLLTLDDSAASDLDLLAASSTSSDTAVDGGAAAASAAAPPIAPLPTGVFTVLTDCYSPTCTREQLCYSIFCPRWIEQHAYLNIPLTGRDLPEPAAPEGPVDDDENTRFWSEIVPASILDATSESEIKRQEAIFELVISEEGYVEDLTLVEKLYMAKISRNGYIPPAELPLFMTNIFGNILDLRDANKRLANALVRRQQERYVVQRIGDVVLSLVDALAPHYVTYAGHHPWAKYHLEVEMARYPDLAAFLASTERMLETRRLPIQSFLSRPVQRLARYPLLLGAIQKRTPKDHPDHDDLVRAVDKFRAILADVNVATGHADTKVRLKQLDQAMVYKSDDERNYLGLLYDHRELLRDGVLRRVSTATAAGVPVVGAAATEDVYVLVMDHGVLVTRRKKSKAVPDLVEHRVYRPLIKYAWLAISVPDDKIPGLDALADARAEAAAARLAAVADAEGMHAMRPRANTAPTEGFSGNGGAVGASSPRPPMPPLPPVPPLKPNALANAAHFTGGTAGSLASGFGDFPFTLTHVGRNGFSITLVANSAAERRQWIEKMVHQRHAVTAPRAKFGLHVLSDAQLPPDARPAAASVLDDDGTGYFPTARHSVGVLPSDYAPHLAVAARGAPRLLVATDRGVFLAGNTGPIVGAAKVLDLDRVTQVEVLAHHGLVLVLADKVFATVPLEAVRARIAALAAGLGNVPVAPPPVPERSHRRLVGGRSGSTSSASSGSSSNGGVVPVTPKPKKVASGVAMIKPGHYHDRECIAVVKLGSSSSIVKLYEPMTHTKKPGGSGVSGTLSRFFSRAASAAAGDQDDLLKLTKELYIGSEIVSVDYVRTGLCFGCAGRGFEVVDPTLPGETLTLVNAADARCHGMFRRPDTVRPLAMFRVPGVAPSNGPRSLFLVCFEDVAFYVDAHGDRARRDVRIAFDGEPRAFALQFPYLIACDARFVEVRDVRDGALVQVIAVPDGMSVLDARAGRVVCAAAVVEGGVAEVAHVLFEVQMIE
ncbi:RHO1 GDP-GTP exchange protein 2 [Allomyces arbusculus]|nr:RHO1 GDP-GTP exchange protein 2 [Allomyces arbusculus]